jgi:hypothetical protein
MESINERDLSAVRRRAALLLPLTTAVRAMTDCADRASEETSRRKTEEPPEQSPAVLQPCGELRFVACTNFSPTLDPRQPLAGNPAFRFGIAETMLRQIPYLTIGRWLAEMTAEDVAAFRRLLEAEADSTKREALSRQVQVLVQADVPFAFLLVEPFVFALRKGRVTNVTPHPNDTYFMDDRIAVN